MSYNFPSLSPSETEFQLNNLPQLFKLNNSIIQLPINATLSPADSARNLMVIFDSNLAFS